MRTKIRWGVGAVAVVIALAFAMPLLGGGDGDASSPGPAPGSCGRVEGNGDKDRYEIADCSDATAAVRVAKVVDEAAQCPAGAPYTTFTSEFTLCLIPNFVEGSCYVRDPRTGLRKVDCGAAGAVRVLKATKGIVDCGDKPTVRYPEPEVTFCLSSPL
ncbi:LppU/SCO3897 family protein [Saccharothrix xinjiangensis]|uniref:Subtilisin inhibitor-like n=1 Tax=Saccharothrix xinjiangensis TaxID=204798 RepID=A0ABV9XWF4_9PSEU